MTEVLVLVDDEQATEWDSSLLVEHAIGARQFSALVGKQGNVHFAKSALLAWGVAPGQVAEVRVRGSSKDLTTDLLEFIGAIGERYDLRWTDESAEIKIDFSIWCDFIFKYFFYYYF